MIPTQSLWEKKVIEWISRESESTMSRLILSSVFFYFAILKMVAFTYSFYLSLHSLYCFDPQSKQRKLKQKLVFTKKIWCVCIRPLLFSCTHMHKKVLLIKIDQTYWHKISTTAFVHSIWSLLPTSLFSVCCWPYKSRNSVPIFFPWAWEMAQIKSTSH